MSTVRTHSLRATRRITSRRTAASGFSAMMGQVEPCIGAVERAARQLDGSGERAQSVTFTVTSARCGLLAITVSVHGLQCTVDIQTDGSAGRGARDELRQGIEKRLVQAGYTANVSVG